MLINLFVVRCCLSRTSLWTFHCCCLRCANAFNSVYRFTLQQCLQWAFSNGGSVQCLIWSLRSTTKFSRTWRTTSNLQNASLRVSIFLLFCSLCLILRSSTGVEAEVVEEVVNTDDDEQGKWCVRGCGSDSK